MNKKNNIKKNQEKNATRRINKFRSINKINKTSKMRFPIKLNFIKNKKASIIVKNSYRINQYK